MKITFDLNAKTGFWAPADNNRRCALEKFCSNLETQMNDKDLRKQQLDDCPCPKIKDAYGLSVGYNRILQYLVQEGLVYNEAFIDRSGDGSDDRFQNLRYVSGNACFLY